MKPNLSAFEFSGRLGRTRYTCHAARYGKGMVLNLTREKDGPDDIWKDDAAWLAEALGGRWARGHQEGYRIAPTRALQWRTLFLAGASASARYFASDKTPYTFHFDGGPKMTLKEALAHAAQLGLAPAPQCPTVPQDEHP